MTLKECEIFHAYLFNKRSQLEDEIAQLQANVRWRRFDYIDLLELLIALARLEMFDECCNSLGVLLGVSSPRIEKRLKK